MYTSQIALLEEPMLGPKVLAGGTLRTTRVPPDRVGAFRQHSDPWKPELLLGFLSVVWAPVMLVVSAARKICQRRDSRTYMERRAATLTRDELAAVKRSFGDDSQGFIAVAAGTVCS